MYASDAQLTASQVLRAFHRDELYLFLGAAFTTVGLVSAAFAFLGRKFDALLIWLALFSILYGQRLWLRSELLALMVPPSLFFDSLRASFTYLVPIPAFFYFEAAGFLSRRGRKIAYAFSIFFLCLFFGTFALGPLRVFFLINDIVVVSLLVVLIVQSLRKQSPSRDFVIIRRGLLVFVAFALFGNIKDVFGAHRDVEPLGFAFFLGTLGYVAARRTMHRDYQLGEIQKELDVARRIQMANLPPAYPNSAQFRVATRYVPMTSVAGDFYDFLVADENQAGLLVADVSGHGVPAALIASMVKLAATSQRAHAADPAALLSGMNTTLCGNTQDQFVTAAYLHLDAASASLRYSAAAHPPLLLLREGTVLEIVENGLLLGVFPTADFSTAVHALAPGDRLVLYTDGIIEAADAKKEEFGQGRLQALLRKGAHLSPQEAADLIIASVQAWSKSQDDDLTVLVCDYTGSA
ncbi:MAG: PP2C family protein-serine/threonine phosphatase [Acidobacteriaceae bacterium]